MNLKKLHDIFPAEDIEWRLQSSGESGGKVWAICLPYITNRAIMERLDEVVGPENWKNEFYQGPNGGTICGISIRVRTSGMDEWITKWDGADNTAIEPVKGGLSNAMKRAAVQWGIGRYLYKLEEGFAVITDQGKYRGKTKNNKPFKWNPPALPSWTVPSNGNNEKGKESKEEEITYEALFEKIKNAKHLNHLKNTWEKYKPFIGTLTKSGRAIIDELKDARKKQLEKGCTNNPGDCGLSLGPDSGNVYGCGVTKKDCLFNKEVK